MNVPKLRFEEFVGDWGNSTISELSINGFSNGVFNDPKKVGSGYRLINVKDMYVEGSIDPATLFKVDIDSSEFEKNKVLYGDIFFTRSSLVKEGIAYSNVFLKHDEDVTFDGHLIRMRPDSSKSSSKFLYYLFKTDKARNQFIERGKTATMTTIGQADIAQVKINLPEIAEQTKIADFLSAVDEKITALTAQKTALTQYKQGMMQRIFAQTLRFKDDNGADYPEWEEFNFNEVFQRITQRNNVENSNVLTISAQMGLINQEEFFNKSVASRDLSGYFLLNKGDFAYNKSYSKGYPMGAIKQLTRYDQGVVSPLYICFSVKSREIHDKYFQYFCDFGGLNDEIAKIAQEGARNHGLLNVSVVEFFRDIWFLCPQIEEQRKIAQFLTECDDKINAVDAQILSAQQWKQGLLQQMFV